MAFNIGDLFIKLGLDASSLRTGMADAAEEVKRGAAAMGAATAGLGESWSKAGGGVQAYGRMMEVAYQENSKRTQDLGRLMEVASQENIARSEREAAGIQKAGQMMEAAYKENAARTVKAFQDTTNSIRQTGTALQEVGVRMAAVFAIPASIGALGVNAFSEFDAAMTRSLAIQDDVSDSMRKRMADAAIQMSRTLAISAKDSAGAFYFLASAGLSAEASLQALPVVAKFAIAGNLDLGKATEVLTQSQTALGLSSKDAGQNMLNMAAVADILVKADKLAQGSTLQFADALRNKAATAMATFDISLLDGITILAAFAKAGITGAKAGNYFQIAVEQLQTAAIKHADAWKNSNLRVYDAQGAFRGLGPIAADMQARFANLSTEQKKTELSMLGIQQRSQFAILPLLKMTSTISDLRKEFEGYAGTVDEVTNKQMQAFSKQMELAWNRVTALEIKLGGALVPVLKSVGEKFSGVADSIEKTADKFSKLSDASQFAVAAFAIAATGFGLFTGASLIFIAQGLRIAAALRDLGLLVGLGGLTGLFGLLGTAMVGLAATGFFVLIREGKIFAGVADLLIDRWGKAGVVIAAVLAMLRQHMAHPFGFQQPSVTGSLEAGKEGTGLPPSKAGDSGAETEAGAIAAAKAAVELSNKIALTAAEAKKAAAEIKAAWSTLGIENQVEKFDEMQKALAKIGTSLDANQFAAAVDKIEAHLVTMRDTGLITTSEMLAAIQKLEAQIDTTAIHFESVPKRFAGAGGFFPKVEEDAKKLSVLKDETELNRIAFEKFVQSVQSGDALLGLPVIKSSLDTLPPKMRAVGIEMERIFKSDQTAEFRDGIDAISHAWERLGGTSGAILRTMADEAQKDFELIRDSAASTDLDKQRSWLLYIDRALAAGAKLPPAVRRQYEEISRVVYESTSGQVKRWEGVVREVSTIVTNFAQGVASIFIGSGGGAAKVQKDTAAITALGIATGLSGPALDKLATTLENLAKATGQSFGSVAQGVPAVFKAWKIAADEQDAALQNLFKTSAEGKIAFDDLLSGVSHGAVVFQKLDLSLAQSAALIASLSVNGEDSKKVTDDLAKAYEKLVSSGISDASGALKDIIARIQQAGTVSQANAVAVKYFGDAGAEMARIIRAGKLDVEAFSKVVAASPASIDKVAASVKELEAQSSPKISKLTQLLEEMGKTAVAALIQAGIHSKAFQKAIGDIIGEVVRLLEKIPLIGGALEKVFGTPGTGGTSGIFGKLGSIFGGGGGKGGGSGGGEVAGIPGALGFPTSGGWGDITGGGADGEALSALTGANPISAIINSVIGISSAIVTGLQTARTNDRLLLIEQNTRGALNVLALNGDNTILAGARGAWFAGVEIKAALYEGVIPLLQDIVQGTLYKMPPILERIALMKVGAGGAVNNFNITINAPSGNSSEIAEAVMDTLKSRSREFAF